MAAPTGSHGVERAVGEFAVPPVAVLVVVSLVKELYGGLFAGVIYLVLTAGIFAGIYFSAKNWNIPYTAGFVASGFVLWLMVPGVVSEFIHPVFGALGTVLGAVFLVLMVLLLFEKSGLDELLQEL